MYSARTEGVAPAPISRDILVWRTRLCYPVGVLKRMVPPLFLAFICLLAAPAGIRAQRESQMPPPGDIAYGSKFFNQLRSLFGRFQDTDLQRSFEQADPIQCSELVSDKGEWRTVAFFNEDRSLGEWCRTSLEEVKSDLTIFTFKGPCRGEQGTIRLASQFPVTSSVDAYGRREITLDKVDVNINGPVPVAFDMRTQAYGFELPYLFLTGQRGSMKIYSLAAPTPKDRYAPEVTSSWECKAVKSDDVTYRFLICRTATLARDSLDREQVQGSTFGASAYFILSDGVETHTSVNLSFGEVGLPPVASPETAASARPPGGLALKDPGTAPVEGWSVPDVHSRLTDAATKPSRLRFNAETWADKIRSPQMICDQKVSPLPAKPRQDVDYCAWHPGTSDPATRMLGNEADASLRYVIGGFDKRGQSPASFVFDVETDSGILLGKLQCYFPRTAFADDITYERWISVVGSHILLESKKPPPVK